MQFFSSHGIKWAIAFTCLFCSRGAVLYAAESLPQRNLLIEWRVGEARQASQTTVVGVGGLQVQTEGEDQRVPQILVLNGGQAKLFVGSSQPYTTWQWSYGAGQGSSQGQTTQTGQGMSSKAGNADQAITTSSNSSSQSSSTSTSTQHTVQAMSQTAFLDLGEGLTVRPRWPGGRAPVRVELEARSRQAGQDPGRYGNMAPDGQVAQTEVATTLSVPLRQWVVVARRNSQVQVHAQGLGGWSASSRSVDEADSSLLEIRVSLP